MAKDLPAGAVGDAVTGAQSVTLRTPFPPSQVGKLPKANVTLDYVGHGAVTARLLDVDPDWNWEPVAWTLDGLPMFDRDDRGNPIGLWIRLTVNGTSRLGYGDCASNQFSSEKVLIGDALRNAAMRFGVALDLWTRGHAEDDEQFNEDGPRNRATPDELTISTRDADVYLKRCKASGLTDAERRDIVVDVTDGRTKEARVVLQSEFAALEAATAAYVIKKRQDAAAETPTSDAADAAWRAEALQGPQTPETGAGSPDGGNEAQEALQAARSPVWQNADR